MTAEFIVEIWQGGTKVAAVYSPDASVALLEAANYAAKYEQDGPIRIKVKNPKERT